MDFPGQKIDSIRACVTTTSYSININGLNVLILTLSFIGGAKRIGLPTSALQMNLLIFCNGDATSVGLGTEAMIEFENLSLLIRSGDFQRWVGCVSLACTWQVLPSEHVGREGGCEAKSHIAWELK
ncbi:hypothetical protein Acr_24g0006950 [Actinidia rufa]|uniref:Uncharacterized protein n=1 Tax=Actinidia rufa TaxID=165716 RepID=A0A7J0GUB6_9ERIC|nr:hypothetical protein Acr_24g0005680 [Actinidia rufa]GFZ14505.1 hypothetical protein Acr_24g0006950 [Actinidia rufa]